MQMTETVRLTGGPMDGREINVEGSGAYLRVPQWSEWPWGRVHWGWLVYKHADGDECAEFLYACTVAGW